VLQSPIASHNLSRRQAPSHIRRRYSQAQKISLFSSYLPPLSSCFHDSHKEKAAVADSNDRVSLFVCEWTSQPISRTTKAAYHAVAVYVQCRVHVCCAAVVEACKSTQRSDYDIKFPLRRVTIYCDAFGPRCTRCWRSRVFYLALAMLRAGIVFGGVCLSVSTGSRKLFIRN